MNEVPRPKLKDREPLWTVAGVTAGVATAIALLVESRVVGLSAAKKGAIMGSVAVFAPLVVAAVGRGKVWSPLGVDQAVEEATTTVLVESQLVDQETWADLPPDEDDEEEWADEADDELVQ